MNLIIDIGNTFTKLVIFNRKNELLKWDSLPDTEVLNKIEEILLQYPIDSVIISEVGKPIQNLEAFLAKQGISPIKISSSIQLPFEVAYNTPGSIGADRLALVAGALAHQSGKNQLIIDAGTCVTYDFVDKNNVYHGGAISPGLRLRFKSLNDYTAHLPLLKAAKEEVDWLGKDTHSSIKAGVIWGLAHEIEGFIVKYNLKFEDLTVYLTGGDEKLLDRYIKNKIFVSSKFLLWEGMNHLLNLNKNL